MLEGYNHIAQAAMGTLFTWGVTALGSALVFVFSRAQVLFDINNMNDIPDSWWAIIQGN